MLFSGVAEYSISDSPMAMCVEVTPPVTKRLPNKKSKKRKILIEEDEEEPKLSGKEVNMRKSNSLGNR